MDRVAGLRRFLTSVLMRCQTDCESVFTYFGGSGFLFRRLDLFYGHMDALFCALRCDADVGWVHQRPLLRLLHGHDPVVAGGRVGDGPVRDVHCLRKVLAQHVGQLQPTAGVQGVAALHNITLPGDGCELNV